MGSVITKTGKRKYYKDYVLSVNDFKRKGFVQMIHKKTGKKRNFKL